MRIGILGSGRVATALGTGFAAAGHDVLLSSRTPELKQALDLPVSSQRDAAEHGEVVVNATTGLASEAALEGVGAEALAGKVLIDVALAVTPEMTLAFPNSSLAERIQARFPQTDRPRPHRDRTRSGAPRAAAAGGLRSARDDGRQHRDRALRRPRRFLRSRELPPLSGFADPAT